MWRAIEIASMDLLGRYANWSGSRVSGMMELMCAITSLSKLHDYRCECYRAVVIVARSLRDFGNRNDGGQLETWGLQTGRGCK